MYDYVTAPAPRFLLRFIELQRLLERMGLFSGRDLHVAELGPGLGDVAEWVADNGAVSSLRLIESSVEARNVLQQRFQGNKKVDIEESLSVEIKPVDVFMVFEVIEHIQSDVAMLKKVRQVIKPGGILVGSVPAYMKKWQSVDDVAGHVRRYERDEIEAKLRQAGFSTVEVMTYGFPVTNLMYPLRQLYFFMLARRASDRSLEESTGKSGISRGFVSLFNKRLIFTLIKIFSPLQRIPVLRECGDGFIFVARVPLD